MCYGLSALAAGLIGGGLATITYAGYVIMRQRKKEKEQGPEYR